MGLDNHINFTISIPSLDVLRSFEICYFRKYWGLRDKIMTIIGNNRTSGEIIIDENTVKEIYNLLNKYSNVDHIFEEEKLSTIWDCYTEVFHIRNEAAKLRFAIDFLENPLFELVDFLNTLQIWEDSYVEKENKFQDKLIAEALVEPPKDMHFYFSFVDAY